MEDTYEPQLQTFIQTLKFIITNTLEERIKSKTLTKQTTEALQTAILNIYQAISILSVIEKSRNKPQGIKLKQQESIQHSIIAFQDSINFIQEEINQSKLQHGHDTNNIERN